MFSESNITIADQTMSILSSEDTSDRHGLFGSMFNLFFFTILGSQFNSSTSVHQQNGFHIDSTLGIRMQQHMGILSTETLPFFLGRDPGAPYIYFSHARKDWRRNAELMLKLKRSRFICEIYGIFEDKTSYYEARLGYHLGFVDSGWSVGVQDAN